ncbi:ribose 5-phosphate isomerase B [Neobacillus sp. NPDC093127]|uniref:ribose 5-phosphate isomerase B n=1 Tax=Neobacillus sp. NPDC093127 TaxID=3364296 RepID=UPI00382C54DF
MMLALGSDHVGLALKEEIKQHLDEKGIPYKDYGCISTERTNYPIYGQKVAKAVVSGECEKGLLFCGTGVGISIAANKMKGVRAVVCSDCYTAVLSRQHNNTNILALGSRVVGVDLAKMIIDGWLNAEFEGGRHETRVDMIRKVEEGNDLSE